MMNVELKTKIICVGLCLFIALSYPFSAFATSADIDQVDPTMKVEGNVSDASGPLIGATVKEKGGSGNGTVTDIDGNFSLTVTRGATLEVSYVGYITQEVRAANCQPTSMPT